MAPLLPSTLDTYAVAEADGAPRLFASGGTVERPRRSIRYAVVGLGHIAQVAVLPAFAHARRNSQLVAVVSGDRTKRREIAHRYKLAHAFTYEEYEQCLSLVDAVYIAPTPRSR